jgi:elongation factor P hydroxylase
LSFDNLNGQPGNASTFADNVYKQACVFLKQGVNERSQCFIDALLDEYRDGLRLQESWFNRSMLGFLPQ